MGRPKEDNSSHRSQEVLVVLIARVLGAGLICENEALLNHQPAEAVAEKDNWSPSLLQSIESATFPPTRRQLD